MLRIHFLQQWFSLSDPAMEEALHNVPLYREFAGLDGAAVRLPDETTILRFRHLLEAHDLAARMLGAVNDILTSNAPFPTSRMLIRRRLNPTARGSAPPATLVACQLFANAKCSKRATTPIRCASTGAGQSTDDDHP
ncbi:hypothetical protein ABIC94_004761 [Variovorax paradoxus]